MLQAPSPWPHGTHQSPNSTMALWLVLRDTALSTRTKLLLSGSLGPIKSQRQGEQCHPDYLQKCVQSARRTQAAPCLEEDQRHLHPPGLAGRVQEELSSVAGSQKPTGANLICAKLLKCSPSRREQASRPARIRAGHGRGRGSGMSKVTARAHAQPEGHSSQRLGICSSPGFRQ